MKRFLLYFAVIAFSVMSFAGCSSKSDDDDKGTQTTVSLKGTTWSGTIYGKSVNVTFSENTLIIQRTDSDSKYSGNYAFNNPEISFTAVNVDVEGETYRATGIVNKSAMKLSVTYKNRFGDVRTSEDILIKN